MSEYESNDIEMDYGEPEEQNEEENEEENYQREEGNNSKYNDNNNYKYNNNYNNSNNYNNNKVDLSQNDNDNENFEEQENNVPSNKYKNNIENNNMNSNKKNQFSGNTMSQDNNTNTIKNENDNEKDDNDNIDESGENPEILYEEFFNYFLPAKKNTLNIKECKNAMRCLGLVVTEREIQDFLEIKEKTGKEKINLDEFKAVCNKKFNETSNNLAELEEAFEMLDPEKTGIVDSAVLRHQMKIFKPKITDEEINQILSEFGEDKNGNINYREYLRNIKS